MIPQAKLSKYSKEGQTVLLALLKHKKTTGKLPRAFKSYVIENTSLTQQQVEVAMEELIENKAIERRHAKIAINEVPEITIIKKIKKQFSFFNIIRVFSVLVTFISFVLSFYFSMRYYAQMFPKIIATAAATVLVLSLQLFFQAVVMLSMKKNKKIGTYFVILFLSFCYITTAGFSMMNTFFTQKSVFIENGNSGVITKNYQNQINLLDEKQRQLQIEIEQMRTDREPLKKELQNLDVTSSKFRNVNYLIALKNIEINKMLDQYNSIIDQQTILVKENESNKDNTTFSFIASQFGVSTDTVEFIILLFFAVFIDIAGPITLSISLFLKE